MTLCLEQEGANLVYMRLLRLFKTVRIFRILRVVQFFKELRIIVFSILASVRSLFWALFMLGLIEYIFALIFMSGVVSYLDRPGADPQVAKDLLVGAQFTSP